MFSVIPYTVVVFVVLIIPMVASLLGMSCVLLFGILLM